jgi:hypothetical protein
MSRQSKMLSVYLDFTVFGLDITLDLEINFSSIAKAIQSLVRAICDAIKSAWGARRRLARDVGGMGGKLAIPASEWRGSVRRYAKTTSNNAAGVDDDDWVGVSWVGDYPLRASSHLKRSRRAKAEAPDIKFETICVGTCECKACVQSVKNLFDRFRAALEQVRSVGITISLDLYPSHFASAF